MTKTKIVKFKKLNLKKMYKHEFENTWHSVGKKPVVAIFCVLAMVILSMLYWSQKFAFWVGIVYWILIIWLLIVVGLHYDKKQKVKR